MTYEMCRTYMGKVRGHHLHCALPKGHAGDCSLSYDLPVHQQVGPKLVAVQRPGRRVWRTNKDGDNR